MKKLLFLLILIFPAIILNGQTKKSPNKEIVKTTYTYKEVDGIKIKADLYKFKDEDSLRPVIVWLHGGALIWGSRDRLPAEQMKFYLDAGYSVISIDYRLAPETKLHEIVEDIKDAITWIRNNGEKQLQIDKNNVFVVGHSAGSYLALMTGYILEDPPQAIVSFYGYGNIAADWYNKPDPYYSTWDTIEKERAYQLIGDSPITSALYGDRFDFYLYCRQTGLWTKNVAGIDPSKEPEKLKVFCPLKNIHSKYPPTLLIHGDKDTDVPILQSQLMTKELTKNKIENRMITMPGYGHVFDIAEGGLGNEDIRKVFENVIEFFDKHRESRTQPDDEN